MARPTSDPSEPRNITIQTKEGTIKIQGISSETYHKTLGYLHSIGRPKQTHFEAVHNKIKEALTKVKESQLDYKDFSRYYTTVMRPKITYTLGLTSLSKNKADYLTTKMIQPTLRTRNFNGKTPRGISLGSKKWGGLQSIDVYIYQGSANLIQLAKASRDLQDKELLFKIAYHWWRYSLGIEICPLQGKQGTQKMAYSDSIWFAEVNTLVFEFKINIELNIPCEQKQRKEDEYTMDIAKQKSFTQQQIKQIN
jgi:hypothetical protein